MPPAPGLLSTTTGWPHSSDSFCAIGRIRYSEVDGNAVPDGTLIYLKPALHGRGDPIPYYVGTGEVRVG